MRDKEFVVRFPVFSDYHVFVVLTDDVKAAMKRKKDCKDIEFDGDEAAITVPIEKEPTCYMFLRNKVADIGTIAHESWHVLFTIFKYVGAQLEDEVVAYHLGYLVNEIVNKISGKKRK